MKNYFETIDEIQKNLRLSRDVQQGSTQSRIIFAENATTGAVLLVASLLADLIDLLEK